MLPSGNVNKKLHPLPSIRFPIPALQDNGELMDLSLKSLKDLVTKATKQGGILLCFFLFYSLDVDQRMFSLMTE